MHQVRPCDLPAAVYSPEKPRISSDRAQKVLLVVLQLVLGVSLFQLLQHILVKDSHFFASGTELVMSLLGTLLAVITTFLILSKYHLLLQQFCQENDKLWMRFEERNQEIIQVKVKAECEVSERQRVEQALLEQENRLAAIFRESVIGIALVDLDGNLMECNPAFQRMIGYTVDDLQSLTCFKGSHRGNPQKAQQIFKNLLDRRYRVHKIDSRHISHDNWKGRCSATISLARDSKGAPLFFIAMVEDISERWKAEEKIHQYQERLQSLASEMAILEEKERRSLACDLHDHIGQILALINIKLDEALEISDGDRLPGLLKDIHELVERSIKDTRSLMFELSPPILYDMGLEAAIEWLADSLQQQHGLRIRMNNFGPPIQLDDKLRALLFRAVRELLLNVVKHARAESVKIFLYNNDERLRVVVEDNGIGFDPKKLVQGNNPNQKFGLFSIKERMEYFGGSLKVDSTLGLGSRLELELLSAYAIPEAKQ